MPLSDHQRLDHQRANPRIVQLWQALQPLKSCVSFMNTGAHPDDETTPMLAALALRDGVKISHACSTRGEGGQNVLGTETAEDLGVIRTREMERAAQVLGITQYWLSQSPDDTIFDFGFSKSGDETLEHWGEQCTLMRFVQILRRERPDIICPTFLDIPGQHGHHRAMTKSAFAAVRLASDAAAFPELGLPVWQVKKLYLPAWSGAGDAYDDDLPPPPATVMVDASGSDAILGTDYAQIAQWSRGFHKTQGMGHWIEAGQPSQWPLHLAWVASGDAPKESSILDNLPRTLAALAAYANAPDLTDDLAHAQASLDAAIDAFPNCKDVAKNALVALGHICAAKANCPKAAVPEVLHRLAAKRRQLSAVIAVAINLRATLEFSVDEIRPGDSFTASLSLFSRDFAVQPQLVLPTGWTATPWQDGACQITVPRDANPSDPYPDTWFPDQANSAISVVLSWTMADHQLEIPLDPTGHLTILPSLCATLSTDTAVLRLSDAKPIEIDLKQVHPADATASVTCPAGWQASCGSGAIKLVPDSPVKPGLHEFHLQLDANPASTVRRMHYQHIGHLSRAKPATIRVLALDIALPKGRIAYIGGGSDRVDQLMRNIGQRIDTISESQLGELDFDQYDSILVGIFAFRTRPALSRRLKDLHTWIAAGGNLVTLYHRPWDNWNPETTPPAMLKIGKPSLRWRVTNENAEVTHLVPDHALLSYPNRIGPDDWAGWQKERGLYFAAEWDALYQPLISMADRNETPLTGGLLSAKIDRGRHTHTSLILHHQLEKMVPGAYRLLANLLSKHIATP